jgi:predicted amidohydrolase YtcJ
VLIRNAEVGAQLQSAGRPEAGRPEKAEQPLVDVRCADGSIVEIGRDLAPISGEAEIDAAGGALIPGLHDHHIHLTALAAARSSIACGPPEVGDREQLRDSLRAAGRARDSHGWLRGVGYHESVAGPLDRDVLDALLPDQPLRIQHATGAAWFLNSAACRKLGLDGLAASSGDLPEGAERDADGRVTGRLFRLDDWLSERTRGSEPPSLRSVSAELASTGVTGVTDATCTNDAGDVRRLVDAVEAGDLVQRLVMMGTAGLPDPAHERVRRAAVKIMVDERNPPSPDALSDAIDDAHAGGRDVALHCVTRVEMVVACAALEQAGALPSDRIEHASVATDEMIARLSALGVTVVTQPGLVHDRGDRYLREVDERDRPWLYRLRAFDDAGVATGGSTDAPYGSADPWRAMRAAVDRRTAAGQVLSAGEGVTPERALRLFTTDPSAPGGPAREVVAGGDADLVLLHAPWAAAREQLDAELVRAVLGAGRLLAGG